MTPAPHHLDDAAAPEAAPGFTPEAVLFEAVASAMIRTLGPKKGRVFLVNLTCEIGQRASASEAIPIRPHPDYLAKREAARQAATIMRCALSVLLAACWRERA